LQAGRPCDVLSIIILVPFAIPFVSFNEVLFMIQFASCLFPQLDDVVAGLERGICTMKKGEKALIMLPPLAYEDKGAPGVPTGSELHFEVELLSWLAAVDIQRNGGIVKKILSAGGARQTGDLDEVTGQQFIPAHLTFFLCVYIYTDVLCFIVPCNLI
jgi:hypothetical protein